MKRFNFFFCFFTFCLITVSNLAYADVKSPIHYEKYRTKNNQIVHLLTVDPKEVIIKPARADLTLTTRQTVADIAKAHGALAGINGGFFKIDDSEDGLPAGILKIADSWHNVAYKPRGAIGWSSNKPSPLIDRIQTNTQLIVNREKKPLHGFNLAQSKFKSILYNQRYPFKIQPLPHQALLTFKHNQIDYRLAQAPIYPKNYDYVYLFNKPKPYQSKQYTQKLQATISIEVLPQSTSKTYQQWQQVEHIVGGAPVLVYNGKIVTNFNPEQLLNSFITKPHARTALGIKKNGDWLFLATQTYFLDYTSGLTIPELAVLMKELGCVFALNLDGGTSTSMVYRGKNIVAPVKRVSDAILILPKS